MMKGKTMYIIVTNSSHWVFGPYDTAGLAREDAESRLSHKSWSVHLVSPLHEESVAGAAVWIEGQLEGALKLFLEEAHGIELEARDDYLDTCRYMHRLSEEAVDEAVDRMCERRRRLTDGLFTFRKSIGDRDFRMVLDMSSNCHNRGVQIKEGSI